MLSGTSTQVLPLSPSLSQPYLSTPKQSPSLNNEVSIAKRENQRKKILVRVIHLLHPLAPLCTLGWRSRVEQMA